MKEQNRVLKFINLILTGDPADKKRADILFPSLTVEELLELHAVRQQLEEIPFTLADSQDGEIWQR